ncbi:tyrosine-type recombinase/integrase [Paludibacterium yongneupense]|uniref:tyrosine-type recombinase/integrase n=1 Tax=Paludibacterium yongneupense TaxID=400061 RepID=UPI0004249FFA|nr:site-specific integrase [Paludibacterium yongneupense]
MTGIKGRGGLPEMSELRSRLVLADWVELSGEAGENRVRGRGWRQIAADDDAAAIESWLATIENPHTRRAYRKEAIRLMAWAVSLRGKAVSSLRVDDLRLYLDWLAAPVRPAQWPAHWRLIQGPLQASSRRQAKVILQTLFDYLVNASYLASNPFRLLGTKQRGRDLGGAGGGLDAAGGIGMPRWLEPELWRWTLDFLDLLPTRTPQQVARAERLRFLLIWLYRTAARRSELAYARMAHIHFSYGMWLWRIAGKGGAVADIPLDSEALTALVRYRRYRALPDLPAADETATPIVTGLDGQTAVEGLQIYSALKWFFARAARAAEAINPGWAARLDAASTHWLRHSLASHAAQAGVPIHLTAERLRHRSHATTQRFYVHASLRDQAQAFAFSLPCDNGAAPPDASTSATDMPMKYP